MNLRIRSVRSIGSDGLPVISHQTGDADLSVTHCTDAACTSSTSQIADNAPVLLGYDSAIAIDAFGLPVITHTDTNPGQDIRVTILTHQGWGP